MKKVNILVTIAILLFLIAIVINNEMMIKKIDELNNKIDQQANEIIKLREENDSLWDNYYMNVSEYKGEYYE